PEAGIPEIDRAAHDGKGQRQDHPVVDPVGQRAIALDAETHPAVRQARNRHQRHASLDLVAERSGEQGRYLVVAAAYVESLVAFGVVKIETVPLILGQSGNDVERALLARIGAILLGEGRLDQLPELAATAATDIGRDPIGYRHRVELAGRRRGRLVTGVTDRRRLLLQD